MHVRLACGAFACAHALTPDLPAPGTNGTTGRLGWGERVAADRAPHCGNATRQLILSADLGGVMSSELMTRLLARVPS